MCLKSLRNTVIYTILFSISISNMIVAYRIQSIYFALGNLFPVIVTGWLLLAWLIRKDIK